MQTLSATVAHTTYSREEYPVILPATDDMPAVVAIPDEHPHEPDYCGGNTDNGTPLGDFLLAWFPWSGWEVAWQSHGTNAVDSCGHAVDPERAAYAINNLPDFYHTYRSATLERWLNMCAPDGVMYRATDAHGYSQKDDYIYVSAFPSNSAPSPVEFDRDAEFSEPINWARGSVQSLALAIHDADSDTYTLDHGGHYYPVYAESWLLDQVPDLTDYAEDFRENALDN